MIQRKNYLERLLHLKESGTVKVITGVRCCGKTTLLRSYISRLREQGAAGEQIIYTDASIAARTGIKDYRALYLHIKNRLCPDRMNYIFFDEVHGIPEFARVCDSLLLLDNVDLYAAGSDAGLLSDGFVSALSGRIDEIRMFPLSFAEYAAAEDGRTVQEKFRAYVTNGAFPSVADLPDADSTAMCLEGIYSSILLRGASSAKKLTDLSLLESILRTAAENVGTVCSLTGMTNALKAEGKSISVHTAESYVGTLLDSFILFKADRLDIKTGRILSSGAKYYPADPGLAGVIPGVSGCGPSAAPETVIYFELLRRGYKVFAGKLQDREITFAAVRGTDIEYYQITPAVKDDERSLKKALSALDSIPDHNPKTIITADDLPPVNRGGIKQLSAAEWLLHDTER